MQLDSHRRQLSTSNTNITIPTTITPTTTTTNMPCPHRRRFSRPAEIQIDENGMENWKQVRRGYLRMMRKQTKAILLLMAFMEALRVGPMQIVYAGRQGFPEPGPLDHGVSVCKNLSWYWL